jgi:hypothetical protein
MSLLIVAHLPVWVTDVGQIVAILLASLGVITVVTKWITKQIGRLIDDKLDVVYRRLDAHMTSEDASLQEVAQALRTIAAAVNVDLDI